MFSSYQILKDFPILMPCLVIASVNMVGFIISFFWLEEVRFLRANDTPITKVLTVWPDSGIEECPIRPAFWKNCGDLWCQGFMENSCYQRDLYLLL